MLIEREGANVSCSIMYISLKIATTLSGNPTNYTTLKGNQGNFHYHIMEPSNLINENIVRRCAFICALRKIYIQYSTFLLFYLYELLFIILGDLLENYCWNDDLMNFSRVLFSISILLTFPIECFVSREVR